ncbi:heterokaryon incompatibility protein-domain-containing protein [Podospora didyma]|uniref:Heterokaryon incompatibility protein-domain-containing protein n=1 Tax=Podospora didyma TaxID=330526 RepID=A0AAE0NQP0_9PEZI|nr:heterokaryon incompatibility protein-domain-containing protein [Podospora didyma]
MRLLNVDTLELVMVESAAGHPYTILSHTWGNGEVTYDRLMSGDYKSLPGYGKIKGCCDVSRKEGYLYTWIDTCCIDKTSSAELSEAINSMFKWYANAEVCYAYLSDVDTSTPQNDAGAGKLADSRWFKRGWTLQELLAPTVVVFLNRAWKEIGTKASLANQIGDITRIHARVLLPSRRVTATERVFACSVAERMSWAAFRETRKPEDLAYCLMGLFDINMPLLYGEGTKAFLRLQQHIAQQSNDASIFAWEYPIDMEEVLKPKKYPASMDPIGQYVLPKDPRTYLSGLFGPSPRAFTRFGNIRHLPFDSVGDLGGLLGEDDYYEISKRGVHLPAERFLVGTSDDTSNANAKRYSKRIAAIYHVPGMNDMHHDDTTPLWTSQLTRCGLAKEDEGGMEVKQNMPLRPLGQSLDKYARKFPEAMSVALLPCGNHVGRLGILVWRNESGLLERLHSEDISIVFDLKDHVADLGLPPLLGSRPQRDWHRAYADLDENANLQQTAVFTPGNTGDRRRSHKMYVAIRCKDSIKDHHKRYLPSSRRDMPGGINYRRVRNNTSDNNGIEWFVTANSGDWPKLGVQWAYDFENDEIFVHCIAVDGPMELEESYIRQDNDNSWEKLPERGSRQVSEVRYRLTAQADAVVKIRMGPVGWWSLLVIIDRHGEENAVLDRQRTRVG